MGAFFVERRVQGFMQLNRDIFAFVVRFSTAQESRNFSPRSHMYVFRVFQGDNLQGNAVPATPTAAVFFLMRMNNDEDRHVIADK